MKIRLVEYKNIVDNSGQAFGHGKKVLYEALKLSHLAGCNAEVAACSEYKSNIYTGHFITLSNAINVAQYDYRHIMQIMSNLRQAQKKPSADIIWFTNTDWYLFLYLGLHHKRSKIIVTVYSDIGKTLDLFETKGIVGKMLSDIMMRGVKKIDLTIETFYRKTRDKNVMYMPDYLYTDFYKRYKANKKKKQIICIGTMNTQKDLEGMVKVFSKLDYHVVIKGGFVDKNLFQKLLSIKNENINIQDCYLDDEEYYEELSGSEYVIAPYNMDIYGAATSGVVREALYMGVKVLAPQKLLDNMGIKIKGYSNIEEVEALIEGEQEIKEEFLQECSESEIGVAFGKKLRTVF